MSKYNGRNSLAEALAKLDMNADSGLSIRPEVKLASDMSPFESNKKEIVDDIVKKVGLSNGTDINALIVKAIKDYSLNEDEGMRIIQAVNMGVYRLLYDQTSGKDNRAVKFNIADPAKVFNKPVAETSGLLDESNEKVASLHKVRQTLTEKLASLDMTTVESYSPAMIPSAKEDFLFERLSKDLNKTASDLSVVTRDIDESLELMGRAFSEYAKQAGEGVQTVFEKMACQSKMRKTRQADVVIAYNKARSLDKKASEVNLELVDIDAVEDFSLGRHSISKVAEQEVLTLPEVSDKKREIQSFEKLVEMALKIQENETLKQNLTEKLETKRELIANATI